MWSFRASLQSALFLFVAIGPASATESEKWPDIFFPDSTYAKVEHQKQYWSANNYDPSNWFEEHTATGTYLNRASICKPREPSLVDDSGLAMAKTSEGPKYNPVMLAQCGLNAYGKWLKSKDEKDLDIAVAYGDKLIETQDKRGAFPNAYQHRYYVTKQMMPAGWTSAMAQGQAISLFVRLFDATSDQRFIASGKLALKYLLTPTVNGGVRTTMASLDPSLESYVFFEEVVTEPNDNYILNGYMFALLGLYDWSQVPSQNNADQKLAALFFKEGIRTLEKILPYYEVDGLSVYDLTHYTFNNRKNILVTASYTGVHVYLLHALHSVTGSSVLKNYEENWHNDLIEIASSEK